MNIPRAANHLVQMEMKKFSFGIEFNVLWWYEPTFLCINIGWFVTPLLMIIAAQTQLVECYTNIINDFRIDPSDVLFPEILT